MLRAAAAALALAALAAPPAAAAASPASKAVRWAERQVGVREVGTTNCSRRITRWQRQMGLRVPPCRPWCGAYVHQAYLRAGIRLSARLIDPARSYHDARNRVRHLRAIPVSRVRRGDLLFFSFTRPPASHIAIATGRAGSDGRIPTVEGNVSHTVVRERRGARYVVLAARVTRR